MTNNVNIRHEWDAEITPNLRDAGCEISYSYSMPIDSIRGQGLFAQSTPTVTLLDVPVVYLVSTVPK
jgi:hypothetical protein